jgi:hypothetical protein
VATFFDASVLHYPSSYSYPSTYETRSLAPVAGYTARTSTFTTINISNTVSSGFKYAGGVLAPNGRAMRHHPRSYLGHTY